MVLRTKATKKGEKGVRCMKMLIHEIKKVNTISNVSLTQDFNCNFLLLIELSDIILNNKPFYMLLKELKML